MRKTNPQPMVIWRKFAGVGLAAPAIAVVALLFVYPFILSFISSLRSQDEVWTFGNYTEAFSLYGGDLLFTLWVCLVSLALLILLTAMIGGFLRLTAHPVLEFIFKIPLFVPFVVVGHAMRVFLAPHGTLNSAIAVTGWFNPDSLPSFAFTTFGLIAALVWKNLGLALLLVLGGFRSVNENMLEAARGMGAGKFKLIWHFLVPMNKGSIGVMAILTFTSMLGCFSIPAMLGNPGGRQMLMMDLYHQTVFQHNYGLANAIGVITYMASLGAAIYYLKGLSKK
ncbi:sugar ABC transporter permease [Paenibacillus sp. SYP-B3998]|uniref:Sugar ABC transporter permease n=1 Tax=Paenibacillus sp. SYP-B3998 TaxID=2678564 RepID=A0A6G3ZTE7_9BACL|nr:sugar ABC transporter permease [Paenibacillus sp. SYP-B3998]NEW04861.1 sugar ABC transporter permease [Paenibacillus sp. SYP-B3998]